MLSQLFKKNAVESKKHFHKSSRHRSLRFEPLEERALLAVTPVISGTDLIITGTDLDDTLDIVYDNNQIQIAYVTKDANAIVDRGEVAIDPALINLIYVNGKDGDDFIRYQCLTGEATKFKVVLNGGDGNDTLESIDANTTLVGGEGDDALGAWGGIVTLDYSTSPNGVNVNLSTNTTIDDGYGTSDTLSGISNVIGSEFNDRIIGNLNDNILDGRGGDDYIDGLVGNNRLLGGNGNDFLRSGIGNDYIDGGNGADEVDYADAIRVEDAYSKTGVTINLVDGWARGNGNDTLVNIEYANGSDGQDAFYVGTNHRVRGGRGNDRFFINGKELVINEINPNVGNQAEIDKLLNNYPQVVDILEEIYDEFQDDYLVHVSNPSLSEADRNAINQKLLELSNEFVSGDAGEIVASNGGGFNLWGKTKAPFDPDEWLANKNTTIIVTASFGIQGILDSIGDVFKDAWEFVTEVGDKLGDFIKGTTEALVGNIMSFAKDVGNSILAFGEEIINVFKSKDLFEAFSRFFGAFGHLAGNFVTSVVELAVGCIVDPVTQLIGTVFGRSLRPEEKVLARAVFGENFNISAVRIVPYSLSSREACLGSIIWWPDKAPEIQRPINGNNNDTNYIINYNDKVASYNAATFVHEMTHYWQRKQGLNVTARSLHQFIDHDVPRPPQSSSSIYIVNKPTYYPTLFYDINNNVLKDKSWSDLNVEQQACAVDEFFTFIEILVVLENCKRLSVINGTAIQSEIMKLSFSQVPKTIGNELLWDDLFTLPLSYANAIEQIYGQYGTLIPSTFKKAQEMYPDWSHLCRVVSETGLFSVFSLQGALNERRPITWNGFLYPLIEKPDITIFPEETIILPKGMFSLVNPPEKTSFNGFAISQFDSIRGTVTFTGDQSGIFDNSLVVWEDGGYLCHNATMGNFQDQFDIDPGSGYARLATSMTLSITIDARFGDDYIDASGLYQCGVTVYGGDGDDTIIGSNTSSPRGDFLYGGNGNDVILGLAGEDFIYGGAGDDNIDGGTGNDFLFGDAGNDTIFSSSGYDVIDGGSGSNTLQFDGHVGEYFVYTSGMETVAVAGTKNNSTSLFGVRNCEIIIMTGEEKDNIFAVESSSLGILLMLNSKSGNDIISIGNGAGNVLSDIIVNAGDGADLVVIASGTGIVSGDILLNGEDGNDRFIIGSGNLNAIRSNKPLDKVRVIAGNGNDRIFIRDNDFDPTQETDYFITSGRVTTDAGRLFSGLEYDGTTERLELYGSDGKNVFDVQPSLDATYYLDGGKPDSGTVLAQDGDYLKLDTKTTFPVDSTGVGFDTSGRKLTMTARGDGYWEFTKGTGHQDVEFTNMEQFNHVDIVAVGLDAQRGGHPSVQVFDAETGEFKFEIPAVMTYGEDYQYGIRVATGDLDNDGLPDVAVAPGPLMAPTIKVFNGVPMVGLEGTEIVRMQIPASATYGNSFKEGVQISIGDVLGDGTNDIILAPSRGLSIIKVFENSFVGSAPIYTQWATGQAARSFNAFEDNKSFIGGATIATGDLNTDADGITKEQIVVGSGSGMDAKIRAYDVITDSTAYVPILEIKDTTTPNSRGGVNVEVAYDSGKAFVVTGTGNAGMSNVLIYEVLLDGIKVKNTSLKTQFTAFTDASMPTAVRVVARDVNDDQNDELFIVQATDGRNNFQIRRFTTDPLSPKCVDMLFANYPEFDNGGLFIG